MWMQLLANKWFRLAGICVLCLSLGYMKGCSTGYKKGKEVVQEEFDEYRLQVANEIAEGNAKVLNEVQGRAKAQSELALLQSKRRDELREEIVDVKRKIEGFRTKLDANCLPTADELRVISDSVDKARAGARKN